MFHWSRLMRLYHACIMFVGRNYNIKKITYVFITYLYRTVKSVFWLMGQRLNCPDNSASRRLQSMIGSSSEVNWTHLAEIEFRSETDYFYCQFFIYFVSSNAKVVSGRYSRGHHAQLSRYVWSCFPSSGSHMMMMASSFGVQLQTEIANNDLYSVLWQL